MEYGIPPVMESESGTDAEKSPAPFLPFISSATKKDMIYESPFRYADSLNKEKKIVTLVINIAHNTHLASVIW